MFFSIINNNDILYNEAKNFFLKNGRSDLLKRRKESLIGAFLVTQHMLQNGKVGFSFTEGKYEFENIFFSTSHSGKYIATSFNDKKIAIDIEEIKPRNNLLLEDIKILDNKLSQRQNFYLERCTKECLIKYLSLTQEDANKATIIGCIQTGGLIFNDINFNYLITLSHKGEKYQIRAGIYDQYIIEILS